MSQSIVTLLLPGYSTAGVSNGDAVSENNIQQTSSALPPAAFSFTKNADRQPWQSRLAGILGIDTDSGLRLPSASLGVRQLYEAIDTGNLGELVCADPIFLKADRDSATFIAPDQLALTEAEADQLLEALNRFVAEDGFRFFRSGITKWYMSGLGAEALASYPPSFLANRKASTFLPDGDGAAPWRRLMTEIQMLLHTHPVNVQRESAGLIPVNSVWFWGGASLPDRASADINIELYTDHQQAHELASYLNLATKPLAQVTHALTELPLSRHIVVLDTAMVDAWLAGDINLLEEHLARVNEQWLVPLARLVVEQHVCEIRLVTEDGLQGLCNLQTIPAGLNDTSAGMLSRLRAFFTR